MHPDEERVKINEWVLSQTNNLIKDLLPPNSIDSTTRMVLVNAIYFKGAWKYSFDSQNTIKAPFILSN